VFSRIFSDGKYSDQVVIGLDLKKGKKEIPVDTIFENGTKIKDAYSGKTTVVSNGKVTLNTDFDILLLEKF
jgi:alpha-amylase